MKSKLSWVFGMLLVFGLVFVACDLGNNDNTENNFSEGKVYFQSSNSRHSLSVRSVAGNSIEFLVSNLLLVRDDAPTNGWLIGKFHNHSGQINNIGWYDIDGLKKATVTTPLNGNPHSCIRMSIKAIKLNEAFIFGNETNIGFDNSGQFDIIAGDLMKLGSHEFIDSNTPQIPFNGVTDLQQVDEFIIVVDESKLLKETEGVLSLSDDWWECFSFSVR
jgi:hypothetical protein